MVIQIVKLVWCQLIDFSNSQVIVIIYLIELIKTFTQMAQDLFIEYAIDRVFFWR